MPSSKFIIKTKISNTFRVEKVKGMFDIDKDELIKEFNINIPIENKEWNVGLIIGSSGSGKTTIAKNLFKDYLFFNGFEWNSESFLDDFDKKLSPKDIIESLSKVGFSSPPDWLKSFHVLSNGQKMRVCRFEVVKTCQSPQEAILYGRNHLNNRDWDEDEEDPIEEWVIDEVLEAASDYAFRYERYKDKLALATRLEEDSENNGWGLNMGEILKILNDNPRDW